MYQSMNGSIMRNLTRYALFRTQGAQIEAFIRKELNIKQCICLFNYMIICTFIQASCVQTEPQFYCINLTMYLSLVRMI